MILDELAAAARERVRMEKQKISPEAMRRMAETVAAETRMVETGTAMAVGVESAEKETGFLFEKVLRQPGLSFICEVKKASPSKGVIAEDFPYLEIAREYEQAGASAVSVLTEPTRFLGQDRYLQEIAAQIRIPVLRKDFTVDGYMIDQAKVLGASAVLLICAILEDRELEEYLAQSQSLGLSALVEAHDGAEVERALKAGARILGVNNRDLRTFQVDVDNSVRLRSLVPPEVVFVSESGIRGPEDTKKLYENGTDAVLIGETLMRSADKRAELAALYQEEARLEEACRKEARLEEACRKEPHQEGL